MPRAHVPPAVRLSLCLPLSASVACGLDGPVDVQARCALAQWLDTMARKDEEDDEVAASADALAEFEKPFVKSLTEAKHRCLVNTCGKLFKGLVYIKKHIRTKHPEEYEAARSKAKEEAQEAVYLDNFLSDMRTQVRGVSDGEEGGGRVE